MVKIVTFNDTDYEVTNWQKNTERTYFAYGCQLPWKPENECIIFQYRLRNAILTYRIQRDFSEYCLLEAANESIPESKAYSIMTTANRAIETFIRKKSK